ncbi:ankyrin repeat domain-containing protein [Actinokineospora xionganensis]|uniref:Ankyrin repeat domain-containing protein n=1 Tax=Actinokineospora xionganensis TaxID=2684470 RepID=A0ABR7L646_9PSEU|nr:ankyrin repeat domain-containing protein [Actinokineospora xionganensis]MBC6448166.1 ankyrin repeat domain-containing protein [Actinokineospora xionganensis]
MYERSPHKLTDFAGPVDEFLAHACLVYGGGTPDRLAHAQALLSADPGIAKANIFTMAVLGDAEGAAAALATDPGLASRHGGPFDWEPLLYLAYARLPGGDPVAVARLLLDAGADPNAGYLWEGNSPPFTALTGAFGEGEDASNQPRHRAELSLARLLLERGADPDDGQTLYNRMFGADDGHLRLLFEFGLGTGDGGPWRTRAPRQASPAEMLHDVLLWAAAQDQRARVELLLAHGVPPESPWRGHPLHQGRSAHELAVRSGNREIAALLEAAGAVPTPLDPVDQVVADAMAGIPIAAPPSLVAQAIARDPYAVVRAAALGKRDAVRILVGAGFDVNAAECETALHQAAFAGNLDLVRLLLHLGADRSIRDTSHGSTPLGWAEHNRHDRVVEYLRSDQP